MRVYKYCDEHTPVDQNEVVRHFANLKHDALKFSQPTLSRNLDPERRAEIEQRANTGAGRKRARVVTHPEIEDALIIWFRNMERKGELVTPAMLQTKRSKFYDLLGIPKEERVESAGWIPPFMQAYGLKSVRRHGASGNVDVEKADEERQRLFEILAKYPPADCFNTDETSFYLQ